MPEDRRESNHKYYEKHKARWKKYRRRAKIKAKRKAVGPYMRLSDKQKTFKRAVDQGLDPAEAVKRAYPDTTNIGRKLHDLKQHPVLAISFDKHMAAMVDAGFTPKYEAESKFAFAERAHKKGSTPHDVRNAIIVLEDWDKVQGLTVERSETRSLNINITMTEEQMEFFLRKQGEMEKRKEQAIDG